MPNHKEIPLQLQIRSSLLLLLFEAFATLLLLLPLLEAIYIILQFTVKRFEDLKTRSRSPTEQNREMLTEAKVPVSKATSSMEKSSSLSNEDLIKSTAQSLELLENDFTLFRQACNRLSAKIKREAAQAHMMELLADLSEESQTSKPRRNSI